MKTLLWQHQMKQSPCGYPAPPPPTTTTFRPFSWVNWDLKSGIYQTECMLGCMWTYQTLQKPDWPRHDEKHLLDEGIQVLVCVHRALSCLPMNNQAITASPWAMHSGRRSLLHAVWPTILTGTSRFHCEWSLMHVSWLLLSPLLLLFKYNLFALLLALVQCDNCTPKTKI